MAGGGQGSGALSQFVFKVHSRCDLACDHCYVYEHADQSWRRQPRAMSVEVIRAAGARIAEHAKAHGLAGVRIVLHGGEPLLLGPRVMRELVGELLAVLDPVVHVDLRMQTNAVRLTTEFCDLFREFDIRVGVSLDGDQAANDRHRRFRNNASSYHEVVAGIALLRRPEYRRSYAGLLCTVDLANDPIAVYEEMLRHEAPRIDFLLPHATWDHPPARPDGTTAPYARWLSTVYDRWLADGRPTHIRLFESLLSTAGGGPSYSEWVGLDPADLAVVETNGAWELADSIKIAYDGAPATGMDVFTHSVDEVAAAPGVARRQGGITDLSGTCRVCPVVRQCGGGLFAHRHSSGRGFDNPSVYCPDLMELIHHMRRHSPPAEGAADVPDDLAIAAGHLDALALAGDDVAAVEALSFTQLSITRTLLAAVAERWPADAYVRAGRDLLDAVDQQAPDVTDEVLRHPYVRAWAVGCLSGTGVANPGYVAVLAAAAAIKAGFASTVTVPAPGGQVFLPTLGTAVLPGYAHPSAVMAVDRAGAFSLRAGENRLAVPHVTADREGWEPTRRVLPGLLLEDADPYRDCHKWKPTDRLDGATAGSWLDGLVAAWRIIEADAPDRAGGLKVGLRTVVPLHAASGGSSRASTARQAFGTIASTLASPQELAVVLVHEFQHGKLNAVLDACDLFDRADPRRLKVGWRVDARPIVGVLHGTFAHQSVADVWRMRAVRDGAPEAWQHYRMYRDWTADAIDALRACGALTAIGDRFVANIGRSMAGWPA